MKLSYASVLASCNQGMKVGYRDTTSPVLNTSTREKNDQHHPLYAEHLINGCMSSCTQSSEVKNFNTLNENHTQSIY